MVSCSVKRTVPQQVINNLETMMDKYCEREIIAFDDYTITKEDERHYMIKYMVTPYEMLDYTMEQYDNYCQKLNYYCVRTAKMLLALDAAASVVVDEYVMIYKDGQGELRSHQEFY
jgi:hypothetical protein